MTITNLKSSPPLLASTLSLIEKAFQYEKGHHFDVDFAPLMDESNHENCFVKLNTEGNVIAHIGFCKRTLGGHPIGMLGGIAVDERYRGEGYFQELMQEIISEHRGDVAFFLLWSDQEKLYKKFGFYLCGAQIELPQTGQKKEFKKVLLSSINSNEKKQIKELYEQSFSKTYLSFNRTDDDWINIEKIQSSDLYIKVNQDSISDYFFMNKGQDLKGIIFEYGTIGNFKELIAELRAYGKVWSPLDLKIDSSEAQYQFLLSPGDPLLLSQFIKAYTNNLISIRDINLIKREVYFDFNNEVLALEIEEFLRGIFGPAPFEEIGEIPPIFISGLDSI